MLILIAGLVFGILLYRRSLRLEGASGSEAARSVRAYVDGKPVASYVKVQDSDSRIPENGNRG